MSRIHVGRLLPALLVGLVLVGCAIPTDPPASDEPATPDKAKVTTTSKGGGREAGTVLLRAKGTGNGNTKRFTSSGDWDLVWSFRCDGDGYYSVDPQEADDRAFLIGPTGDRTNKGTEHYHEPGRWHLQIITGPNCSWNLRAVTA
jgi:hypothetical protein